MSRTPHRPSVVVLCLLVALVAACGGGADDGAGSEEGSADTPSPAEEVPRILALGEEALLADLLALGVRPVASSANVVVDGGFVGLEAYDTTGIEAIEATQANIEHLATFDVDVVLANEFTAGYVGEDVLGGLGELVVVPDAIGPEQMRAVGAAVGRSDEAEALITRLDDAVAAGRAEVEALPEADRTLSLATIYTGPSVALWVDGPFDVPATLLALGFILDPGADDVTGAQNGRLYLSEEQIGLLDAATLMLVQNEHVEGESESVSAMADDPLWSGLPAVAAGRVLTVDRLGYPGLEGRIRLVGDLLDLMGV